VVETYLPAYDLAEFVSHQLRWARGVRDARARGYLGLVFTFGIFWALLAAGVSGGAIWSLGTLALTVFLRGSVALLVGRGVLRDREVYKYLWLIPIRDLIAVAFWMVSLHGHTVSWRGDHFVLKDGRLTRIEP